MSVQGRPLSDDAVRRIVQLLSSTDMAIKDIAVRFSCSRSAVASINRRFQIRRYSGLRSSWLNEEKEATVKVEEPAA